MSLSDSLTTSGGGHFIDRVSIGYRSINLRFGIALSNMPTTFLWVLNSSFYFGKTWPHDSVLFILLWMLRNKILYVYSSWYNGSLILLNHKQHGIASRHQMCSRIMGICRNFEIAYFMNYTKARGQAYTKLAWRFSINWWREAGSWNG